MQIVEITKDITIVKPYPKIFLKGQLYLFNTKQLLEFKWMCLGVNISQNDFSKTHEIGILFKDFNLKSKNVYIHRTSGIGDLIALSSLCSWLYYNGFNIIFITQTEYYSDVFDWFQTPVKLLSHISVLPFKNDIKYNLKQSILLEYESKIENSKENWYELFFKSISNDIDFNEYGRPKLKIKTHGYNRTHGGVLFTLRASANIRSIDFKPVYLALHPLIKGMDIDLYIHEQNISKNDSVFIQSVKDSRIKILPKCDLRQFLMDAQDAQMVISTDTGSLHFREGIGKVALGIYNAFSSDCRCKYYQFVKTIDVKSSCIYQPCFLHVQQPGEPCLNKDYCMDMEKNKTLVDQLNKFFKENI